MQEGYPFLSVLINPRLQRPSYSYNPFQILLWLPKLSLTLLPSRFHNFPYRGANNRPVRRLFPLGNIPLHYLACPLRKWSRRKLRVSSIMGLRLFHRRSFDAQTRIGCGNGQGGKECLAKRRVRGQENSQCED